MIQTKKWDLVSYIVLFCTLLFLLMLLGFPFYIKAISLGLYMGWLFILWLPTYIVFLLTSRRLLMRKDIRIKLSSSTFKSLLGIFRNLFWILLMQLTYSIGFSYFFGGSLVVQGLQRTTFAEIKTAPEKSLALISRWFATWDYQPSSIFLLPPLLALISYLIIVIPILYLAFMLFSRLYDQLRKI